MFSRENCTRFLLWSLSGEAAAKFSRKVDHIGNIFVIFTIDLYKVEIRQFFIYSGIFDWEYPS